SLCPICAREKARPAWYQECGIIYFKNNFINWTSGNPKIDEIIKETQMNSKTSTNFVEWLPYEQFKKIEKIGPLTMSAFEFERIEKIRVALKGGISPENLEELRLHIKCCTNLKFYNLCLNETGCEKTASPIIHYYGLTKRLISESVEEHMLVIQFAEDSDLLKYLYENFNQMK
ncbi:32452_t:CDS:2, partial [Gigaspora margarita]